jgi:hypothetical protein
MSSLQQQNEGSVMECITWFVPILPGKLEAWKAFVDEINGPRKDDFAKSRQRLGASREVIGLVQSPEGDFAALFHEGESVSAGFSKLAASEDPFDVWFKDKILELHGVTKEMLAQGPPSQVVMDYRA